MFSLKGIIIHELSEANWGHYQRKKFVFSVCGLATLCKCLCVADRDDRDPPSIQMTCTCELKFSFKHGKKKYDNVMKKTRLRRKENLFLTNTEVTSFLNVFLNNTCLLFGFIKTVPS